MADEKNPGAPAKSPQQKPAAAQSVLPMTAVPLDNLHPDLTADVEVLLAQVPEAEREAYIREIDRIAHARRAPFGTQTQKLALAERPGYKRHWFNDSPGRIEAAEENGWTKIKAKDNKVVRRVVGSGRDGGALYAYAMEIPTVFWQREMDARHRSAQARMDDIKKNPIRAPAGMAQPSDKEAFYSPAREALSIKETVAHRREH